MANTQSALDRFLVFIFCLFLGWLGIDKLYVGGLKEWKVALIKFALCFVVVGLIWNVYDMICAIIGKYQINPLIEE